MECAVDVCHSEAGNRMRCHKLASGSQTLERVRLHLSNCVSDVNRCFVCVCVCVCVGGGGEKT